MAEKRHAILRRPKSCMSDGFGLQDRPPRKDSSRRRPNLPARSSLSGRPQCLPCGPTDHALENYGKKISFVGSLFRVTRCTRWRKSCVWCWITLAARASLIRWSSRNYPASDQTEPLRAWKMLGNNKHCVVIFPDTKKPPWMPQTAFLQRVCSTGGSSGLQKHE